MDVFMCMCMFICVCYSVRMYMCIRMYMGLCVDIRYCMYGEHLFIYINKSSVPIWKCREQYI